MNIYFTTYHTTQQVVNESDGSPEDEMRLETVSYYELVFPAYPCLHFTINITTIIEHYYYGFGSHYSMEDYYIPYNTEEISSTNVSFESLREKDRRRILEEIDELKKIQTHFKENVLTELYEKALHPDRLEWIF
jgi:hypothetical protein